MPEEEMPRFPKLLAILATAAIGSVYGGQVLADSAVSTRPVPPTAAQPTAVPQPSGVNNVSYPQSPAPAQTADQQQRKPPRIWLFMGFGF
jgi:hypothetical protein